MSRRDGKNGSKSKGNSTATLDPVDRVSDPGLLDQLAKQLNAAPLKNESIDFERVRELETRLADREQLVSVLTERLEQAADELDRIKRTGGVLSGVTNGGPDLASMLEGHQEVSTTLNRFVEAWEERYEGPALRRMEASIDELRERLEQTGTQNQSSSTSFGDSVSSFDPASNEQDDEPLDEESSGLVLQDTSVSEATGTQAHSLLVAPIRVVLISNDEVPDDLDVPLPEPVDSHNATELQLRNAITCRDAYIGWLCQQVRDITGRLEGWLTSLRTESHDTTLHQRVDEIELLIRDQLRLAEINVSIERARLSRDQSTLQEGIEQLNHDREQLAKGMTTGTEEEETPLVRRWKKFMKPSER